MRKNITALLLAAAMLPAPAILTVRADDAAVQLDKIPAPFFDDGDSVFYQPCGKLDTLPDRLTGLVSDEKTAAWFAFFDAFYTDVAVSLSDYPNIRSFIIAFSLTDADVTDALSDQLTEEELPVLLSGTDADILNCFASEYTIVIGDRFYTPQWLYESTEEDYAAAALTPELILEKLPFYQRLHLTAEAAAFFSEKLTAYLGQPVTLTGFTEPVLTGDVDQDGSISVSDAVLLQKYLLGTVQFNNTQYAAADMNADGMADVFDLAYLKKEILARHPEDQSISLPVIEFSQHPDYPTGCESAALYMLLRYYQTDVTMAQIVDTLPKGPKPYSLNGVMVGANPEREFVGDPRDSNSYGVFNVPLAKTAAQFRSGVLTKTGASISEVLSILNTGNPVVVWYTTNPDTGITYRREWYDYETNELIRWPSGEHAVVVCGHDGENLTYRDPNTGGSRTMAIEEFRTVFDELGGRILYYEN